jgi:hypothetical protein
MGSIIVPPELPSRTILLCEVGSTSYGIGVGSDDRDEMGICLEGPETTLGLESFEQTVYRSAAEREGRQDARSQAGDLDRTVYSARKFCRLALKGNPTVQALLFNPKPLLATEEGKQLRDARDHFTSRKVVGAFLGYMNEQLARLEGRRGQKSVKRPELIEKYGFDTKYAGHVVRLGFQGIHYARTGEIPIPLPEHQAGSIRALRTGLVREDDMKALCSRLLQELEELFHDNPADLPKVPDTEWVSRWLIRVHREAWERQAGKEI